MMVVVVVVVVLVVVVDAYNTSDKWTPFIDRGQLIVNRQGPTSWPLLYLRSKDVKTFFSQF